jgi:tetratricopeptide (TPR) repeat protein
MFLALEYSQKSLDMILSDDYMKTIDLLLAARYNNIGYIYLQLNKLEQSLICLNKALDYTKSLPSNIPIISRIYCNMATNYEQDQNYSKSEFYWKKGLEHHLQSMPNNTDQTAYLYQAVALNLFDHQKYEESIIYFQKSLTISKNPNQLVLYSSYKNLGASFHFIKDYKQADEYLQKALIIGKDLSSINLSVLYLDMGKNFYMDSKYQQALDAFGKALELAQSSLVLTIHAMIFAVYTNQNKPNRALNYYKINIQSHVSQLDRDELVQLYFNIGINYYQLKNYNQALANFQIALELISSNRINAPSNQLKPHILTKITFTLEKLEKWSQLNEYLIQLMHYQSTPDIYMRVAISFVKQEKFQQAIDHMKQAYDLAKNIGDIPKMTEIEQCIQLFSRKIN